MLAAQATLDFFNGLTSWFITAITTPGPVKVGLFTNSPTLSIASVIGDLVEPTFTGYSQATVTHGSLRSNANSDQIIPFTAATFQPTATVTPGQIANGYFWTNNAVLWFAEYFDTPFAFNLATDAITLLIETYFRNNTIYGGLCATC